MQITHIAGGILLSMPGAALPEETRAKLLDRWDNDGDEDSPSVATLLDEAEKIACPKAFLRPATVDAGNSNTAEVTLDNFPFSGPLVQEKLGHPGMLAVGYVMTCGEELFRKRADFADDFLAEAIWEEISAAYLGLIGAAARTYTAEQFFPEGSITSLNPGSLPTWPIECQTELFALLGEGASLAGVTLTSGMLMLPYKSGSGIFFSGGDYENCERCPREGCPNRRKPFLG